MGNALYRLFVVAVFMLTSLTTHATGVSMAPVSDRVVLNDQQGEYPLGLHALILEDPSEKLTVADVINPASADRFFRSTKEVPGFGFTPSAYWIKVDIERQSTLENSWLLEFGYAPMQWVDVYTVTRDGQIHHQQGGSAVPFSKRPYPHHKHVFQLTLPIGEVTTLVVRVDGESSKTLPLNLRRGDVFAQTSAREIAILSVYSGIIVGLFLYNVFIFAVMRESAYLFYLLFLSSFLLFSFSVTGILQQIIHADIPDLAINILPTSMGLVALFGCQFAITFLGAKQHLPKAYRLMSAVVIWGVISSCMPWFLSYHLSIINNTVLSITFSIVLMLITVIAVRRGYRPARFYLLAWCLLLFGIFLYAFRAFGLLPTNILTEYAIFWGSSAEAILLSVALAARMRLIKEENAHIQAEKLASQEALLEAKEESLHNKQIALTTVQEYSTKLESEVKARTVELIDIQNKLIATEKMAALGVFSAGMAHEINNPANFVAVGAQNAEAQLSRFQVFVEDLLDHEEAADIRHEFSSHFTQLSSSLEVIKAGILRIDHIIKNLRANHPEGPVELHAVDILSTLESARRLLEPTLKLPVQFDSRLGERGNVMCVVAEIQQVFLALLSNAAHAIEDAKAQRGEEYQGTILLSSTREDTFLVIEIRDNGIGIPADKMDKIFDPFFTTKTVGRGVGLGLSMARDIVLKHRGSLTVSSRPEQGTTFTLRLPLAQTIG